MRQIEADTWEEFEACIKELRQHHHGPKPLLFRGQDDAAFPLATTLERAGEENMRLTAYFQMISSLSSEVETHTGTNWEMPNYNDMDPKLRACDAPHALLHASGVYSYMLYLRHHRFPSPLLDWTRSPYVAAYFAFCTRRPTTATFTCPVCGQRASAKLEGALICGKCYGGPDSRIVPMKENEGKVSIYAFSETPEGFKSRVNNEPTIIICGHHVRGHRRHFLQQSDYSICVGCDKVPRFVPHEKVFDRNTAHQDVLTKINIPLTERLKVLRLLGDHNLNAYSLFTSEESLIETMAFRALDLTDRT